VLQVHTLSASAARVARSPCRAARLRGRLVDAIGARQTGRPAVNEAERVRGRQGGQYVGTDVAATATCVWLPLTC